MNFTVNVRSQKVIKLLSYFAVGFLLMGILSHQLKYGYELVPGLYRWFNTDGEKTFPALFSCLLLFAAAGLLLIITVDKRRQCDRYANAWGLLTLIFSAMAVDEWMSFHERMNDVFKSLPVAVPTDGIFHFAWIIGGIAFVTAVGLTYRNFLLHLPRRYSRLFLTAAGLYILGAIGLEMVSGYYADNYQQWNGLIWLGLTTVEEGLEMFGVITFIYALLHYIHTFIGDLSVRIDPATSLQPAVDAQVLAEAPAMRK